MNDQPAMVTIAKRNNAISRQYSDSAREMFLGLDTLLQQWRKHNGGGGEHAHAIQDTLEAIRAARATLPTFDRGQR